MLESLKLKNFTAFADAKFDFADGLNVIVGENGTGKSHVLKLAYSCLYVSNKGVRKPGPYGSYYKRAITEKLLAVFKPDGLGSLVRRTSRGQQRCEVRCEIYTYRLAFSFNSTAKSLTIDAASSNLLDNLPVYLPTRELLTIYPGFVSLYETTHLQFDETWRDTCVLLGAPLVKGLRTKPISKLLVPLEEAMGGKVELTDSGQFYLNVNGVRMEMHLVAEGLRKLAMIARLIATGSLIDKGYLFWDEPEANLNPKIIKMVARTILHLCRNGIQVFIASHSLFLLRELDILLQTEEYEDVSRRFFGLHKGRAAVSVQQGETIDDIGTIDALDEELTQSDRYLATGID